MHSTTHLARFTDLCRQLDMITDTTSLATWVESVKTARDLGKITNDERLTLAELYRRTKPKVRAT